MAKPQELGENLENMTKVIREVRLGAVSSPRFDVNRHQPLFTGGAAAL